MNIKKKLIPKSKYKIKSPYKMNPVGLAIHNTANDASAKNEIAYMTRNNNQVSYHLAVDDKEAIQAIPFNRNAWHAGDGGNGKGNRKYIGMEICYSKSGGAKFDKAERNAAKVAAQILKQFGWTISDIKRHKDFSGKNCPHRTMAKGWTRFLNMVKKEMKLIAPPRNYVKQGDKGDSIIDIKQMQSDLIELGYGKGELKANGHFGSTTDKYVRQFQRDTAAKVNGAVGPKTLGIIKEMKNNKDLFYRTVTGSFKDKKEAETRVEELKKAGFDSFIDEYKK